ncbi:MAG TPA: TonB-dependent receptor plug domain-containing protein, partial [Kiloniellales bacterium]|nr:TonB-dependent receptor plug domain-containing protein [Kiloniellales bacterium]
MRSIFRRGQAVSAVTPLVLALALTSTHTHAQEQPTTLDPLVVTATRTERPLSTVGSSLTLITAEDLEERQTTYVADVLREVPGVSVNR